MKGDKRCVEGRLLRHDPQFDDPYLETDVGQCPDCGGAGCEEAMTTDDELLALARKATPGEWRQDVMYVTAEIRDGRPGGEVIVEARATVDRHRDRARDVANAAYIAAANPAAIIAMIERHRAEVERLTGEVIGWRAEEFSARDRAESAEAEVERLTRERDEALLIAREKENQLVAANLDAADLSKKQRYANHYEEQIAFLVERFAEALSSKLRKAEEKYQYQGAWRRAGWASEIREALLRHVDKGDPLDVAAYCAFAWHHGWTLAAPDTAPTSAETALAAAQKRIAELQQDIVDCGKWTGNVSKPDEYMLDHSAFDRLRKSARTALAGKEDGDAQGAVRE